MCTYLLLREVLGPGTVALAANRDEAHERAFDAPALVELGGRRALMPRDRRAGGTWLGTNGRLLVALTNAPLEPAPARAPSRGRLVRALLACGDAAEARAALRDRLAADPHAGFNLLVAGAGGAWAASHSNQGDSWRELGPGTHLLHDRRAGSAHVVESPAAASALVPDGATPRERLEALARDFLASHENSALLGRPPCRHGETRGTVASTLIFLDGASAERSFLLFAHGPPCTTPFVACPWPDDRAPARPERRGEPAAGEAR